MIAQRISSTSSSIHALPRMTGVAALLIALLPPFADAQQSSGRPTSQVFDHPASVTPYIAMYIPVGSLVADHTVRLRPVGALALGSRFTLPINQRFAVEAALTWSPNLVAQSDWKETVDLEGGVWFSSARARVRVAGAPGGDMSASIASGLGLVHRYGDAWTGMRGTTDAAVVFGGGLKYVDSDSGISFTVDVESFLTHTGYTDIAGQSYGNRVQKDFLVSLGTSINLGR